MEEPKIILSEVFFDIPPDLLAALRARRGRRGESDPIEDQYDAFLLDPGLGPPTYLTAGGRILWQEDGWGVKASRAEVYIAITAGAKKSGILKLLTLLPRAPLEAKPCGECDGTGMFTDHGQFKSITGELISIACWQCGTLGWRSPSLDLSKSSPWVGY